ncbi:hypothetical protein S40288_10620 [Stachybotrys chartarum IBT 40288]|nr:hypothetical protein S40288_10620 [Stachybotrys chartarum IBT 40288]
MMQWSETETETDVDDVLIVEGLQPKRRRTINKNDRLSRLPSELLRMIFEQLCPHCTNADPDVLALNMNSPKVKQGLSELAAMDGVSKHLHEHVRPVMLHCVALGTMADRRTPHKRLELLVRTIYAQPMQGKHIRQLALTNEPIVLKRIQEDMRTNRQWSLPNRIWFRQPFEFCAEYHAAVTALTQLEQWHHERVNGSQARRARPEAVFPETKLPTPASAVLLAARNVETLTLDCSSWQPYHLADPVTLRRLKTLFLSGIGSAEHFAQLRRLLEGAPRLQSLYVLGSWSSPSSTAPHLAKLRKLVVTGFTHDGMRRVVEAAPQLEDVEYYILNADFYGADNTEDLVSVFAPAKDRLRRLYICHLPNHITLTDEESDKLLGPSKVTIDVARKLLVPDMIRRTELRDFSEFPRLEDFGIDFTSLYGLEALFQDKRLDEATVAAVIPPSVRSLRFFYGNGAMVPMLARLAQRAPKYFPKLEWMAMGTFGDPEQAPIGPKCAQEAYEQELSLLHSEGGKHKYIPVCWLHDSLWLEPSFRYPDRAVRDLAYFFPRTEGFWEEFEALRDTEARKARTPGKEFEMTAWKGCDERVGGGETRLDRQKEDEDDFEEDDLEDDYVPNNETMGFPGSLDDSADEAGDEFEEGSEFDWTDAEWGRPPTPPPRRQMRDEPATPQVPGQSTSAPAVFDLAGADTDTDTDVDNDVLMMDVPMPPRQTLPSDRAGAVQITLGPSLGGLERWGG